MDFLAGELLDDINNVKPIFIYCINSKYENVPFDKSINKLHCDNTLKKNYAKVGKEVRIALPKFLDYIYKYLEDNRMTIENILNIDQKILKKIIKEIIKDALDNVSLIDVINIKQELFESISLKGLQILFDCIGDCLKNNKIRTIVGSMKITKRVITIQT